MSLKLKQQINNLNNLKKINESKIVNKDFKMPVYDNFVKLGIF